MYIKLPLTLLLLSTLSYASDLYIKLGTTTSKKQVQQIENIVRQKGYRVSVDDDGKSYRLYVGSFASKLEALEALQRLKPTFPAAVAVKLRPQSLEKSTPQSSRAESSSGATAEQNRAQKEHNSPFFVQVALGFHNSESSMSGDVEVPSIGASGVSYGVAFGYELSDQIWASVDYDMLGTDSFTLSNIYTTLNYNFFQGEDLDIFAGATVGYSSLSWDSNLLDGGESSGPTSFFAGAQIGVIYPVMEGFSVVSSYTLRSYKLNTVLTNALESTSGAIEQSMTHKVTLGLQYNF